MLLIGQGALTLMTGNEKHLNAEQDLEKALNQSRKILGGVVPRLLTQKPLIAANSISHGLTGQTVFLEPDDLRFYLSIGAQYMEEFRPIGVSEIQLAQLIIDTQWRLNRAGALSTTVHTSTVILEAEALHAANPHVGAGIIHAHAEALAVRRQCEGPNTLEKLGRHETRLWRALRQMRKDFREMCDLRPQAERDAWTAEASEACQWYNTLSTVLENLIEARKELQENCVTVEESADSLLCKKPVQPESPQPPNAPEATSAAPKHTPRIETDGNPSPLRAAA
jgi:hypothetical protein